MIGGLDVHEHVVTFDTQPVNGNGPVRVVIGNACLGVVHPAVKWADDFAVHHRPLTKRSASVLADVIDGMKFAADIRDAHHRVPSLELIGRVGAGKLFFRADSK